ncbi:MAG: tetratricopeptide repeat protein [Elusimicrobia bacterium]|nr:tetratricopeptide repeat protein [Elusimicrobiota bacterium]
MSHSRYGSLAAALSLGLAAWGWAAVSAPDIGLLQEQNRIKKESEEKIQKDILDPMLGKGMAMVFVDVEMEVKVESEQSNRTGMGLAEKYREKSGAGQRAGLQTTFVLPGIPKPRTITQAGTPDRPESASAQQAQQVKGIQEERYAVKTIFKRLGVTVAHDEGVLREKTQIDLVRNRIVDAMAQYKLAPDQVLFRPTPFYRGKTDWREDLKRPEVYIPLLFALLLLLFLLFLFGPLWRFFRQYVAALREKPAAEVNIENEGGGEGEEGKGEETSKVEEQSKMDITFQTKPPEPPPELEEEDDMKKFEPFSYINEDNIKRLAYMFLLRKEEPWVVAVVASYLRPDFAKQLISCLPVDLQAKVALEALRVRQVTREQVIAIDTDIKENVDFVVGGMERLTAMLDEVDVNTRNNILNYLKNEKPLIYEQVRKHILVFEDVVGFPDRDMQVIVRELKTESMARALQGASPEVINKFFSNMSQGASSLLKESMEYTSNLTPAQVDEERVKIMETIKVLDREGKITVRKKGGDEGFDLIESLQEDLSAQERRRDRFTAAHKQQEQAAEPAPAAAPAGDPAQAQAYFDAGVSYHSAGQMEQSLRYFQAALSLNPALWQAHQYLGNVLQQLGRTSEALAHYEKLLQFNPDPQIRQWVESFKAQAGARG